MHERVEPAAAAKSVVRRPSGPARIPASAEPAGIVPQYMSRTIEFIRPRSRAGVIAWRNVSWFTFAKKPTVDATKHVNGGCRSLASDGMTWQCYLGEEAVQQQIVGESFLGEYAPSPGHG